MIKRKEHAPYSIRANLLPTKREKENKMIYIGKKISLYGKEIIVLEKTEEDLEARITEIQKENGAN